MFISVFQKHNLDKPIFENLTRSLSTIKNKSSNLTLFQCLGYQDFF